MKKVLCVFLLIPPPAGSQLSEDENLCATCHTDPDLWEEDQQRLCVAKDRLEADVHWNKGVNCHDCHGGDPSSFRTGDAHAEEAGFRDLAEIRQLCAHCHQDQSAVFARGAHAEAVVKTADGSARPMGCVDCHGPDQHSLRPSGDQQSPVFADNKMQTCGNCHTQQFDALHSNGEVHSKLGEKDAEGQPTPMRCGACHTEGPHDLLAVNDYNSPVFMENQVETCGGCHEQDEKLNRYTEKYKVSVHGNGLYASGLMVTAVCSSCHGAHGIYHPAADDRSTLHDGNVAQTCGKCHHGIEERLAQSVHGNGPDGVAAKATPDGDRKKKPSCTVCHEGHDLPHPKSREFRRDLPTRCGNCHQRLSTHYAMSLHGALTDLGYGPAAKCSDCHGAHDILPISDPASRVSNENRQATCGACHVGAGRNFVDFDPHADHTDAEEEPLLHTVYVVLLTLIFVTFGAFGLHSAFWLIRGLIDVIKAGHPKSLVPGEVAYVRFHPFHRWAHTLLIVSFLGLALTGLPLKYHQYGWAKFVASSLGGFESTSVWHRLFGLVNLGCLAVYLVRMGRAFFNHRRRGTAGKSLVFGPDSPVPNWRDVKDLLKMIRWFFGLGPKPTFERWTYWEKFDFWGAAADIVIIGVTGLILWFPHLFCSFLPGVTLNIAKVIHSTQALLATGFVFAIHFFNTHFRPDKFPADMSILTGLVSEEEMREERPEYFARLEREGKLDELRTTVPSRCVLWGIRLTGYLALMIGLALLAGILLAALGG